MPDTFEQQLERVRAMPRTGIVSSGRRMSLDDDDRDALRAVLEQRDRMRTAIGKTLVWVLQERYAIAGAVEMEAFLEAAIDPEKPE